MAFENLFPADRLFIQPMVGVFLLLVVGVVIDQGVVAVVEVLPLDQRLPA